VGKKSKKPQPINEPVKHEPDDEQELPEHHIPTMSEILGRTEKKKGE
jgi:hypothetical protein